MKLVNESEFLEKKKKKYYTNTFDLNNSRSRKLCELNLHKKIYAFACQEYNQVKVIKICGNYYVTCDECLYMVSCQHSIKIHKMIGEIYEVKKNEKNLIIVSNCQIHIVDLNLNLIKSKNFDFISDYSILKCEVNLVTDSGNRRFNF